MKIEADAAKCCGSGMCVLTDPDVFDQSEDDGTVIVLDVEPAESHHAAAREAAALCPAGAITVHG
ncbi:ferredoxin [Umezawaea sp.]|uniref:ferredoxin n=1 Tax=Umezawaea sp. TaxID=1955258 RepID=UPI002ED3D35E